MKNSEYLTKTTSEISDFTSTRIEQLRHRLHGRSFKSKRFHDLETASKTTRFQGVYTEPIQPFMSRRFRSQAFVLRQLELDLTKHEFVAPGESRIVFGFSLRYSAGAYRRKSQHFKTSLPVSLRYGSRFIVKYTKAAEAKLNHRSKL